jgi:hypothetical protein
MELILKHEGIVGHNTLWKDRDRLNFPNVKADQIARGWEDCAYHYFIELVAGWPVILTGRPIQFEGGHTTGQNNKIGIAIHGNFDEEEPSPMLIGAMCRLICGLWITYPHLYGKYEHHNRHAKKTCPGRYFPSEQEIIRHARGIRWAGMEKAH